MCEKTGREPSFDETSCELFAKETITSSESFATMQQGDNVPIHGWLVFFCIAIGLGGIITFIYSSFTGDFYDDYGGSIWIKAVDVSSGIISLIIVTYVIFALIKRKKNAVFFAKAYIVMVFVTNSIALLGNFTDESNYMTSMSRTIFSLVWGIIWFLYLTFSEQLLSRFPKSMRKVEPKDWLLALSMLYVPLFFFAIFWISGDNTKITLRETANQLNAEKYNTEGLDSVSYDGKTNVFSYYYQCDDEDVESLGIRAERNLKAVLLYELQEDVESKYFLDMLIKAKAALRYVYQTPYGEVVKLIEFSPDEMRSGISVSQMKENALNIIENEAKEANASCPYSIDDWLVWSSCIFDRQRVCMVFTYTVLFDKHDINRDVLDEVLEEARMNMIESCENNSVYKNAGLSIEIVYRDNKNDLIDNTIIGPNDY